MIFGKHPHQNEWHWDDAPPWAIELGAMILYTWEQQMAAIDDLKTVGTNLTSAVTALAAAVDARNSTHTISDADLVPVIAELTAAVTAINDAATKIAPPA